MRKQNQDTQWFQQWFDENYLMLYRHRDRSEAEVHARLIIDTLNPSRDITILDLACGEGRYSVPVLTRWGTG